MIFFEELRRDDDIRNTGFIFEAQEYESFRSAGTLADDDCTCHADDRAIAKCSQTRCRRNAAAIKARAMLRHRMMAGCDACAVKIRGQALFIIHGIERREKGRGIGIVGSDRSLEKSASGAAGAFDLPQSAAA